MARIKRIGLSFMGMFRQEEVLPNEFSSLKTPIKQDYNDFLL